MKQKILIITSIIFLIFSLISKGICQWILTEGPKTGNYSLEGVTSFAMRGVNLYAACKAHGGIFHSTDNGLNWAEVHKGLRCDSVYALASNGTDLFSGSFVGVSRLNDDDTSWTLVDSGLNGGYVRAMIVNGSNVFTSMARSGVFLSTNNGSYWTKENNGLTDTNYVQAFAVNGSDLFAGTYWNGVFRSTDNGKNWNEVSNGLTCLHVNAIAAIGTNLFAGTRDSGIFLSTNNGANWKSINSGLTDLTITTFATSGTYLFAGSGNKGVFFSSNNGTDWNAINGGLSDFIILSLFANERYLFAGTGYKVWRRPLSDFGISDVKNQPQPALNISLSPNPTTGILSIRNAPEDLTGISILNVLGEKVMETSAPHSAEFTIDLSKLPVGIYLARFEMAGSVVTRKIVKE